MLTLAAARSYGRLDNTTATDITRHWNLAYPTMRATTTRRITTDRQHIANRRWDIDPTNPNADLLRAYTRTEPDVRRSLRHAEELRRTLHQLNNGTHRPCTQSPAGFSITAAYSAVRDVLPLTTINDRGLTDLYQLAALLAYIQDSIARERATA